MMWARLGAAMMMTAVALGAFGAHALESRLSPEMLAIFEVGVRYHACHALGLIAVGWLATSVRPGGPVTVAGWCFTGGILLFSGSLYFYALTASKALVFVTPVGGLLFLAGWAAFFFGAKPAA